MKNLASIGAMMVSTVRMKIDCFESLLTIMRMVSYPEDGSNFSMKSMEMEFQGYLGTRSCLRVLTKCSLFRLVQESGFVQNVWRSGDHVCAIRLGVGGC